MGVDIDMDTAIDIMDMAIGSLTWTPAKCKNLKSTYFNSRLGSCDRFWAIILHVYGVQVVASQEVYG